MTQSDTGTTLTKLRRMIESMQKEEMVQVQRMNSDALSLTICTGLLLDSSSRTVTFLLSNY